MSTRDEKVKRFAEDPALSGAVYEVLLEIFLEAGRDGDVQTKAGAQIAIHNLLDAWKKIESYKHKTFNTSSTSKQIGL